LGDLGNEKMNLNEYFSELVIEFPVVKTEIESEDPEMVHSRMEIFSNYNIEQIKTKKYY